jgi:hypothetical protein
MWPFRRKVLSQQEEQAIRIIDSMLTNVHNYREEWLPKILSLSSHGHHYASNEDRLRNIQDLNWEAANHSTTTAEKRESMIQDINFTDVLIDRIRLSYRIIILFRNDLKISKKMIKANSSMDYIPRMREIENRLRHEMNSKSDPNRFSRDLYRAAELDHVAVLKAQLKKHRDKRREYMEWQKNRSKYEKDYRPMIDEEKREHELIVANTRKVIELLTSLGEILKQYDAIINTLSKAQ